MLPTALILLFAIALIVIAHRGRAIDDHPLCRHCGFDLFNRPPDSTRCPECGRDTIRPRALRIGHREPRRRLRLLGYFLAVPAAMLLATLIYLHAANIDTYPYRPLWMLRSGLFTPDTSARSLAELRRRTDAGRLSEPDLAPIVDVLLIRQADAALSWDDAWGEFLENARDRRLVSDATWQRFLNQTLHPDVTMRTRIRHGDPFSIRISGLVTRFRPARLTGTRFRYRAQYEGTATIGTSLSPVGATGGGEILVAGSSGGVMLQSMVQPQWTSVGPGAHTGRIELRLTLRDLGSAGAPIAASATVTRTLAVTVLPSDQSSVGLLHRSSLHQPMLDALTRGEGHLRFPCPPLPPSPADGLGVRVFPRNAPCDAVFRIALVQGDRRWAMANPSFIRSGPHDTGLMTLFDRHPPASPFTPGPAELVFTPDPQAAVIDPDINEIFGEELRIPVTLTP